jgi:hypothetical protein
VAAVLDAHGDTACQWLGDLTRRERPYIGAPHNVTRNPALLGTPRRRSFWAAKSTKLGGRECWLLTEGRTAQLLSAGRNPGC